MRKTTAIASAFAILPALLNAQPVLRRADLAPFGHTAGLTSAAGMVSPGAGGPGQTWDFSGTSLAASGTVTVADPATSPTASSHPTANYAWKLDLTGVGTGYSYQKVSDTQFESIADGVTTTYAGKVYTNPITTLVFPFAFGDSASDTYQYAGTAENPITLIYDGYGTVKLPGGIDVANCVRVRQRYSGGSDFTWYRTAPVFPVAIYSYSGQKLTVLLPGATGIRSSSFKGGAFATRAEGREIRIDFPGAVPAGAKLELIRPDGTLIRAALKPAGEMGIRIESPVSGLAAWRLTARGTVLGAGKLLIP